jgi:hypothetical protein
MAETRQEGSGITFYAAPSTNPYKVAIALEELGFVKLVFPFQSLCNGSLCVFPAHIFL